MLKFLYKSKIILFIMLLVYFKPVCFQYFSSLNIIENFFVFAKILIAGIVIFCYIFNLLFFLPKLKINYLFIIIFAFETWIFLVTLYKGNAVLRAFIDLVTIYSLVLLISSAMKEDINNFIITFSNMFLFLTVMQCLSIIVWPNGLPADLYNNKANPLYFVTVDNGTASLIIIAMMLLMIKKNYTTQKGNSYNEYIAIAICILTGVVSGSTTAILCSIFYLIYIYIMDLTHIKILENPWGVAGIYCLLFLCVVYSENSFVLNIINSLIGKEGFTGRTFLWENAIKLIQNSPVMGYGRLTNDYLNVWGGAYSSHNIILEILLQGGGIALSLWCIIMILVLKRFKYWKNIKEKRILIAAFIMMLIALMMEANVHSVYLFSIITIIYNGKVICKNDCILNNNIL